MWEKIVKFFKSLGNAYYKWKKRNDDLSKFLEESKDNQIKLTHIDATVTALNSDVQHIKEKVHNLEEQVDHVNGRIEVIGQGTKMELFDTLHTWRVNLVTRRKWASPAEKKDVKEIYKIYHDELKGNGLGKIYYEEIMALPESEEELQLRRNQNGKV